MQVGKSIVLNRYNFDNIYWAMLSIFQVVTLEDWEVIMFDAMKATNPFASLYFVGVVVIGVYIFLALFLAILLDNFGRMDDDEVEKEEQSKLSLGSFKQRMSNALLTTVVKMSASIKRVRGRGAQEPKGWRRWLCMLWPVRRVAPSTSGNTRQRFLASPMPEQMTQMTPVSSFDTDCSDLPPAEGHTAGRLDASTSSTSSVAWVEPASTSSIGHQADDLSNDAPVGEAVEEHTQQSSLGSNSKAVKRKSASRVSELAGAGPVAESLATADSKSSEASKDLQYDVQELFRGVIYGERDTLYEKQMLWVMGPGKALGIFDNRSKFRCAEWPGRARHIRHKVQTFVHT